MKNARIALLGSSIIVLMLLAGCSGLEGSIKEFQPAREVRGNTFSSSLPGLRIKVSDELAYLGTVQENAVDNGSSSTNSDESTFEAFSYLFGQAGPGKGLTRGIVIRVLVARGNPNQEAQERFLREIRHQTTLESGRVKILEEEYRQELSLDTDLLTPGEKGLLKGAPTPSFFLVKTLEKKDGFGGKSRALISYFEDASQAYPGVAGSGPAGPGAPDPARDKALNDFKERSFASLRFLKADPVMDTTSRYVDLEAGGGEAGEVKASVQGRLETLKSLFDKGLITKDEYEKKKAEILKEL